MTTIRLPWPDKALSPNARVHWRTLRSKQGRAKTDAWALARAVNVPKTDGPVTLSMKFCPPNAARRDLDNVFASMKGAIDGIALAMDTDDRHFGFKIAWGEKTPGGAVIVEVTA